MKLSASLLALVAVVPAVFAADPPVGSAFSPAGHGGSDPASPVHWRRVLFHAIREHIDLAKLTVNFIAKNFENPPRPDSVRMQVANAEFTILAPGIIHFVDRESGLIRFEARHGQQKLLAFMRGELEIRSIFDPADFNDATNFVRRLDDANNSLRRFHQLASLNNVKVGDIYRIGVKAPLQFNTTNFETNGVHVLCDGAQARAERLWEFYSDIQNTVLSTLVARDDVTAYVQGIEHRLPPMPVQLTNEAVRELLLSVADELSRCLSELYDAQTAVDVPGGNFRLWLYRFMKLHKALSKIRIYDNDPLTAHGLGIHGLLNAIRDGQNVENHRFHALAITRAADLARAIYNTDN